ncbi:hypothetical protein MKEN_01334200 [Mycena kentingensis (nom. inval.)]|nr:hypothetical protein MKEN_01334200 [Mycena kentingensis (nom. inval.)]
MLTQIVLPVAATLALYIAVHALQIVYRNLSSPLRFLPGPGIPSFILGNSKEMMDDPLLSSKWRKEFGHNFIFHGLFGVSELHTSDLSALNHIVTHSDIYQKSSSSRESSRRLMGEGSGFYHEKWALTQFLRNLFSLRRTNIDARRVLNPAFGIAQIRLMTEIFVEKSVDLRDMWARQIAAQGSDAARIDVLSGLRRVTLDVIGCAGFGYDFDALAMRSGKPNALNTALTAVFHSPKSNLYATMRMAQGMMPFLKLLPLPGWRVQNLARERMFSIGHQIVQQSKAVLAAEGETKPRGTQRDLISVLLKANMAVELPESQRLTVEEVVAQIPAFFLAGHETTSSATAWALHALSLNQPAQTKLREELMTLDTDNPTLDELNALPYLDKVVRETLRAYAPVVFVQRMAMQDDVLPLGKPVLDGQGREVNSLPIRKGQLIHVPLWAVNTSTEIWGDDAAEFRPERWDTIPAAANAVPGVWANLFTFFAGPRNCIGFRFSLAELKSLLFVLIRAFNVEPAVPKGGIGPFTAGPLQRPADLAAEQKGSSLPLILRPVNV